jgi:dihydroorotate dehydrogenase
MQYATIKNTNFRTDVLYRTIIKPTLFRIDPERVHSLIVPMGEIMGKTAPTRGAISLVYGYRSDDAEVVVDGVRYHTPVVLSAGFDPNGRLAQILPSVGFGGIEVGSVTSRPCKGNPPPNQTRLTRTKSIVVFKGLRNEGVYKVAARLKGQRHAPGFAVGVSIARTNDEAACALDEGIEDYATSFAHVVAQNVGAWITVNISCPNTFTGELFIRPENLELLLMRLDLIETDKPVYLKMPISVPEAQFRALCEVAKEHRVRGLIIGNLQKDYAHIKDGDPKPASFRGGLSGMPCQGDSNRLLSLARDTYGERFTLIGCGGVFTVEDAMEKFDRGASLIHLITGMIYTGPSLMGDIARAYAKRQRQTVV